MQLITIEERAYLSHLLRWERTKNGEYYNEAQVSTKREATSDVEHAPLSHAHDGRAINGTFTPTCVPYLPGIMLLYPKDKYISCC
ncbi:unnamed protein product [Ixodes pacificus]